MTHHSGSEKKNTKEKNKPGLKQRLATLRGVLDLWIHLSTVRLLPRRREFHYNKTALSIEHCWKKRKGKKKRKKSKRRWAFRKYVDMKFNNAFWSIHFCIVRNNLWILYKSILYLKNHEKKNEKKCTNNLSDALSPLIFIFSRALRGI